MHQSPGRKGSAEKPQVRKAGAEGPTSPRAAESLRPVLPDRPPHPAHPSRGVTGCDRSVFRRAAALRGLNTIDGLERIAAVTEAVAAWTSLLPAL